MAKKEEEKEEEEDKEFWKDQLHAAIQDVCSTCAELPRSQLPVLQPSLSAILRVAVQTSKTRRRIKGRGRF